MGMGTWTGRRTWDLCCRTVDGQFRSILLAIFCRGQAGSIDFASLRGGLGCKMVRDWLDTCGVGLARLRPFDIGEGIALLIFHNFRIIVKGVDHV